MARWKMTDAGGYTDLDQQMLWKDILQWQVDMFFYSSYLYYVIDNPKLDDASFDRIIEIMEQYYDELPDRIKHVCGPGQIKATAHLFAHDLSEQEIKDALEWRYRE
jgi:NAD-dependent DNA ligase